MSEEQQTVDTKVVDNTLYDYQSPKKVTFKLLGNETNKQILQSDLSRKLGYQTDTADAQPEQNFVPPPNSRPIVQPSQPRYKKGMNAKFLRQNPRFINEPIRHILPNEMSTSVEDCLHWDHGKDEGILRKATTHNLDSTSHSDYQYLPGNQRPPPLHKHITLAKGIVPLINEPSRISGGSKVKEHISYQHQYNCRTEPSEPLRGKLHGSFVWKPSSINSTEHTD